MLILSLTGLVAGLTPAVLAHQLALVSPLPSGNDSGYPSSS